MTTNTSINIEIKVLSFRRWMTVLDTVRRLFSELEDRQQEWLEANTNGPSDKRPERALN